MVEINLLPWRAYRRESKQKSRKIGMLVVLGLLFVSLFFANKLFHASFLKQNKSTLPSHPSLFTAPFQLTGYLYQDGQAWALVVLPNGALREVHAGTALANDWHVVTVDEKKVIVTNGSKKMTIHYPI